MKAFLVVLGIIAVACGATYTVYNALQWADAGATVHTMASQISWGVLWTIVAGGVLVGAGVAAIAGATAPVWAVGVVSTGVIMGMNWACEKLTDGQDLSEIVSDGYLNLVGDLGNSVIRSSAAVIDNTISIGNEVGKAVSAFSKSIATSWKNLNQWV